MPTISIENYLKAIWALQQTSERVKTKALADRLAISAPSATQMLRTLESMGFVAYAPYQGAVLTSEGERAALGVVRKHRLIEAFLVTTLGYTWDEVHDEAERLEHAVSDDLIDRIDAYLAFPAHDPHGDPIPTADGEIRRHAGQRLTQLGAGDEAVVLRVLDQDPSVLRVLTQLGVVPGAKLVVVARTDDYRLEVDGAPQTVSERLASALLVTSTRS